MSTEQDPRITGAPDSIWLCYGDLEHDDTHAECCRQGEVTWCEDKQGPADVQYIRAALAAAPQWQPSNAELDALMPGGLQEVGEAGQEVTWNAAAVRLAMRAAMAAAPVTCQTYGPSVAVPCAECNQTLVDSQELAELRARVAAPQVPAVPDLANALRIALEALDWYGAGHHDVTLHGRIDWVSERERLTAAGFSQVAEAYNGDEYFVEKGQRAEAAAREIRAMLEAAPGAPQPAEPAPPSDDQILAAARALNKLQAESCGVDEADSWKLYGNSYIIDASKILRAAHGIRAAGVKEPGNAQAHSTEPAGRGSSAAPGCAEPAGKEN